MSKLVSVIIPTFNRAALVVRAIHSVLNQSYKNFEIIVVDDGSDDNTEDVLAPLIKSNSIKYLRQNNLGVSSARNFGFRNASGEWVAFLDSDDEWINTKLEEQVQFLNQNPQFQIVYTDEVWIRNNKRVNPKLKHQKKGGQIFNDCVQQCFIAPSSVMIHQKLFQQMNGFNEEFTVCEDYDLWLRISSVTEIGFISKNLIVKYGGHEDQLSTKYFAMDMWRIKAMKNILLSATLPDSSRQLLIDSIKQKGSLLIGGYLKHNNPEKALEVKKMLSDLE